MTSTWSLWRGMRLAIWLTCAALACGRSAAWRVITRTPWQGVVRDASVGDGLAHEQPEQGHYAGYAAVGEMVFEVFDEHLDGLPVDLHQLGVAEAGQDVGAQVAAVGGPFGRAGEVAGFPDGHPFGQGDPPGGGVEVGVQGLVHLDLF